MKNLDFRSDTLTQPTDEMRAAMAAAIVGDDVYGEDPTVRSLEDEVAALLGKERALFVPTGTMGNQIALHLHGRPGQWVLCEENSHIVHYELGAMATISGLLPKTLSSERGLLTPEVVEEGLIRGRPFESETDVLSLENTHNLAGGTVLGVEPLTRLADTARERGVRVHLDGARLWNAAAALDVPIADLAAPCDSVTVCLSKGLGAPVGSLLAGSRDFIGRARTIRKRLGGGMRQVGILAAAGLVALEERHRLVEDHNNARLLAEKLNELPFLELKVSGVETNIVVCQVKADHPGGAAGFVSALAAKGFKASAFPGDRVRLVTHRDVRGDCMDRALSCLASFAE